ncbi:kinase-like domain-containing protein [Rhizophagus clarus]|uniref:Kinase-like domain-containing protein n=1 Tax=Rhizophagus clarus TaxID=94130 RepID=A0A8H3R3K9_9GLOM|nr:kinase-like domain-containing protein [Rhizophagus clarus]
MSNQARYSNIHRPIPDEHIKYYDYSHFKDVRQIRNNMFRATWKITNRFFALKSLNNNNKQTFEQIIKELKLYRSIDSHENILQFYGITNVETDVYQAKKYSLVLEYADSGTLNDYLNKYFNELDWDEKYQLSLQLTSAVEYIHNCGIIHCDLHPNNILVHKHKIKIADFGLSKRISVESIDSSKIFDVIPYMDPKIFNSQINYIDENQKYKFNEKSDIYSIGVLMWQISSGYQPFFTKSLNYDISLVLDILNGKREKIIHGTPIEYYNLYKECWKFEPSERPNMQKVVSILSNISKQHDIFTSKEIRQNSKSNKKIMNNDDLMLENITSNLNLLNLINNESGSSSKNNLSDTLIQLTDIFDLASNKINNIIIDEFIAFLVKKHDKDITFGNIKQLISQQILQLSQATDKLIKWLSNNQDKTQYIWFLGLFYYFNIGIKDVSSSKAFELFLKAANKNYPIAQVYLAKCYYDGYGTKIDYNLAFSWCKKSVENESIIGRLNLGYCYKLGIGTMINKEKTFQLFEIAADHENSNAQTNLGILYEKGEGTKRNLKEAIYWYNRAAENGNKVAQYYLGKCFELGNGIQKDVVKAFGFYKMSADQEYLNAIFQLGYFYFNGIGTEIDKEKAFNLYEIAAKKGHNMAQNNLGILYENGEGIGVEKNEVKAFEYYKKSASKNYLDAQFKFGYCHDEGIGTEINKKMAFELYKEAAEKENSNAQMFLGNLYKCGQGTKKDIKKAIYWYRKAAENGNKIAQNNLSRCCKGFGIEVNREKAFELYKTTAKKVHSIAQNHLERLYRNGEGEDLKDTFYFYNKAAESGCEVAQCYLGSYYECIVKNKIKAFGLYKKSAKKEYLDAQFQLGYCYDVGNGTEINKEKAFKLYKKLAEKEYSMAQNNLGILYINGEGTGEDLEKAIFWHNKAAKNGCDEAKYNLDIYYEYIAENGIEVS